LRASFRRGNGRLERRPLVGHFGELAVLAHSRHFASWLEEHHWERHGWEKAVRFRVWLRAWRLCAPALEQTEPGLAVCGEAGPASRSTVRGISPTRAIVAACSQSATSVPVNVHPARVGITTPSRSTVRSSAIRVSSPLSVKPSRNRRRTDRFSRVGEPLGAQPPAGSPSPVRAGSRPCSALVAAPARLQHPIAPALSNGGSRGAARAPRDLRVQRPSDGRSQSTREPSERDLEAAICGNVQSAVELQVSAGRTGL
jgi:hypothetical protein